MYHFDSSWKICQLTNFIRETLAHLNKYSIAPLSSTKPYVMVQAGNAWHIAGGRTPGPAWREAVTAAEPQWHWGKPVAARPASQRYLCVQAAEHPGCCGPPTWCHGQGTPQQARGTCHLQLTSRSIIVRWKEIYRTVQTAATCCLTNWCCLPNDMSKVVYAYCWYWTLYYQVTILI